MKGQYKTPTGILLTVVIFDEPNKMVYVENKIGTHKWYHENEYSTWESLEVNSVEHKEEIVNEYVEQEKVIEPTNEQTKSIKKGKRK